MYGRVKRESVSDLARADSGNDVQFVNFAKELSKGVVDSVGRGLGSVL